MDRERVAERLRQAAGEGRLLAHELEERLARAFRAVTYGDLDDVVSDLPTGAEPARRGRRGRRGQAGPAQGLGHSAGWTAFTLARRYPIPVGIIALVTAVTVAALVTALVAIAFSGIWLIPLIFFLVMRGRGMRGGRGGRRGAGQQGRVHVHVHRWDSF